MRAVRILLMGVAGSGKSRLAKALAQELDLAYFDADDFHSPQAVASMAGGQALSDAERQPWLAQLVRLLAQQPRLVLACSALRQSYRSLLQQAAPDLQLCYLQGDFASILVRLQERQRREGHFFAGPAMLQSQFATLEPPTADEAAIVLPIALQTAEQVELAAAALRQRGII